MKLNKKKQKKIRFSNLLFCLSFFLFIPYNLSSEEGFSCKTKKQSGLSNLGGEHKEILNYLGLTDFEVKFSRSREDIFRSESEQLKINKYYIPKNSHFIELFLSKTTGEIEIFECTWLFNINKSKINEKSFNCLGKKSKSMFSIDIDGNFIYSSRFNKFGKLRSNSKVYHSLFGSCRYIKNN